MAPGRSFASRAAIALDATSEKLAGAACADANVGEKDRSKQNVIQARKHSPSSRPLDTVISPILTVLNKFQQAPRAPESMKSQPLRLFFGVGLVGWRSRRTHPGLHGSFLARQRQVNLQSPDVVRGYIPDCDSY